MAPPRRRPQRSWRIQELGQVVDYDVRPPALERLGLPGAVDADDPPEVARPPRLHACLRVFEDRGLRGLGTQELRAMQEGIRRRLAGEALPLGHLLADEYEHTLVLARPERVNGLRLGRIRRRPHRQVDLAGLQERADSVETRLTVHELV